MPQENTPSTKNRIFTEDEISQHGEDTKNNGHGNNGFGSHGHGNNGYGENGQNNGNGTMAKKNQNTASHKLNIPAIFCPADAADPLDRKSTRLNSSH